MSFLREMDEGESMDVGGSELPEKWSHLQKLLCRGSPLAHPDFEPSDEVSVCLSVCLSICLSVCVYVSVCVCV